MSAFPQALKDWRRALFSTYAEFGTAAEVALSEMKIALMFPADVESEAILRNLPLAGD